MGTDEDLLSKFSKGVANVAALSLAIKYPTVASVPHSIVNGMKNLLAVAAATEITFKEAETVKAFLADPSAFAAVAALLQLLLPLLPRLLLLLLPRRRARRKMMTWASASSTKLCRPRDDCRKQCQLPVQYLLLSC